MTRDFPSLLQPPRRRDTVSWTLGISKIMRLPCTTATAVLYYTYTLYRYLDEVFMYG